MNIFLLTRPSRDVTKGLTGDVAAIRISTHTPLAGRDAAWLKELKTRRFLLTRPSRDVTAGGGGAGGAGGDFYSHAPRGT